MIQITNEHNSKCGNFDGLSTNLLIGESNTGCNEISIQITNVMPGKMQPIHRHPQYQCYYIVKGKGQVIIDDDEAELLPGDAVLIPSNSLHGIKNTCEDILLYLTANKAFGVQREKEIWFDGKNVSTEMRESL